MVSCPETAPVTRLCDLVARMAARRPAAVALADRGATVTYAQLWLQVSQLAAGLRELGAAPGDRVAIYLEKRVETVAAIFGAAAAGAIVVPVNPLLRPGQVGHVIADCEARFLVSSGDRLAGLGEVLTGCKSLSHAVAVDPAVELPGGCPVVDWSRLCGSNAPAGSDHATAPATSPALPAPAGPALPGPVTGPDSDPAAILYTSGSTGMPKGVVLSHRNLIAGAESVAHYLGNRPDDVLLAALPLSFDAGLSQLTTGFHAGARVVLMNYLLPRDVVRLCARHRVTGLTCVPPLWIQMAEQEWPPEATRSLRYFANTGGRLPRATLDRLRRIFPAAAPYLMYGLTEAFRSTYLDPSEVDRRPDSIGKPIPNAEVQVVRPDGSLCDPEEEGELVHRGPLVALGYWNDPERSAARFRPAPGQLAGVCVPELAVWSGDRVVRDRDGFLYFVGRTDEMIKTSGYRVSPTEIEEAAYETGLVGEAAAVGLADPRLGQRVVLVVTAATPDPELPARLLRQLRASLPRYMVPQRVLVREALPRSPNGKLDRTRIRAELAP